MGTKNNVANMLTIWIAIREVGLELGFATLEDAWRMRVRVGSMLLVILIVMPQTQSGGPENGHKPVNLGDKQVLNPISNPE